MQYIILQLLYLYQNPKNQSYQEVNNYWKPDGKYSNLLNIMRNKILRQMNQKSTVYLNYLLRITCRVYKLIAILF